jgi:hypothetical protein
VCLLTAAELKAAWSVASELFLGLDKDNCTIVDLSHFPPGLDMVTHLDEAGKLHRYPVRVYGRFRLAYDEGDKALYVGLAGDD